MNKINLLFKLVVLDFISDWYSMHRIHRNAGDLKTTFNLVNKLRGQLRDKLEEDQHFEGE